MKSRDIYLYLSGLITGDLLVGIWYYTSGMLPINFLGIRITAGFTMWWMLVDAVLIFVLLSAALAKKGKK